MTWPEAFIFLGVRERKAGEGERWLGVEEEEKIKQKGLWKELFPLQ